MSTLMCRNFSVGPKNSPIGLFVCLCTLDCWQNMQERSNIATSWFIRCQTYLSATYFWVDLMAGWAKLCNASKTFFRNLTGTYGRISFIETSQIISCPLLANLIGRKTIDIAEQDWSKDWSSLSAICSFANSSSLNNDGVAIVSTRGCRRPRCSFHWYSECRLWTGQWSLTDGFGVVKIYPAFVGMQTLLSMICIYCELSLFQHKPIMFNCRKNSEQFTVISTVFFLCIGKFSWKKSKRLPIISNFLL